MLNPPVKQFIPPFSTQKSRGLFSYEVETAAVYALVELERTKGGGLIIKQHHEKLLFIAKMGYPLWLFPKNEITYIFDGLSNSNFTLKYADQPSAKAFMESLETNSKTRDEYKAFLADHASYFLQPRKEKEFSLRGIIVDTDFKKEFNIYRKEAVEVTTLPANLALIPPILGESTVSSMLAEMDKLQSFLKEDAEKLPECLRLVNKTTSQYITEVDYEAEAVRDEANAKIRAQEEFVNPKIAKLNSEYKRRIADVTRSFDNDLETCEKLKERKEKLIGNSEEKIKLYQREAMTQAEKKHTIYEKRWKEKSNQAKKELNGIKKELKNIEKNIKNLIKQKTAETSKLRFELDAEIKLARQPIIELEAFRDTKMLAFKNETEKLIKREKPVIEGLNDNVKLRETINSNFEMLGVRDQQLKSPALFYVPFYVACCQAGLSKRYIFFAPSTIGAIGFAARLKGVLGMSKIKQLFVPRFKDVIAIIDKLQVLAKQDTILDNQITDLGEKNNLLKTDLVRGNIAKGLVYLKHEGWLSDGEYQDLTNSLKFA